MNGRTDARIQNNISNAVHIDILTHHMHVLIRNVEMPSISLPRMTAIAI